MTPISKLKYHILPQTSTSKKNPFDNTSDAGNFNPFSPEAKGGGLDTPEGKTNFKRNSFFSTNAITKQLRFESEKKSSVF